MGLYIHSLQHIPEQTSREYFVYLLDYGWNEPLGKAVMDNYAKMAGIAAENNAVVIKGTQEHFADEVLSWHHINGIDTDREDILPAILITNRHPKEFKDRHAKSYCTPISKYIKAEDGLKMILLPLRKCCDNTTDAIELIEKVFKDIKEKKDLADFRVAKEMNKGVGRAIVDAIILEPNCMGIGFSFNRLKEYFGKK